MDKLLSHIQVRLEYRVYVHRTFVRRGGGGTSVLYVHVCSRRYFAENSSRCPLDIRSPMPYTLSMEVDPTSKEQQMIDVQTNELSLVAEDTRDLLKMVRERLDSALSEAIVAQYYSGTYQQEAARLLLSLIGDMSSALNIAYQEVDTAING